MPLGPRSTALAVGFATTTGTHVLYTAPSGYVVLVKSAVFNQVGAVGGNFSFSLSRPTAANLALLSLSPPSNSIVTWEGWHVLLPTDELFIQFDTSEWAYWISGAVLPQTPSAS